MMMAHYNSCPHHIHVIQLVLLRSLYMWNSRMSLTICIITRITSPEILYNIIFFKFRPSSSDNQRPDHCIVSIVLHFARPDTARRIQLVVRALFNIIRCCCCCCRWIAPLFFLFFFRNPARATQNILCSLACSCIWWQAGSGGTV